MIRSPYSGGRTRSYRRSYDHEIITYGARIFVMAQNVATMCLDFGVPQLRCETLTDCTMLPAGASVDLGGLMVGAELVVGYVFGWLLRKAKHAANRADGQVDAALDASVDSLCERLHGLVSDKLARDPGFDRLTQEAAQGQEHPSPRTAQRVALALEEAAEEDEQLAREVDALITQLQALGGVRTNASDGGVAVTGALEIQADSGSIAAAVIHGGARVERPHRPDPPQG
ncbi:hypothetical protein [Streptomyces sp. NPDC001348]